MECLWRGQEVLCCDSRSPFLPRTLNPVYSPFKEPQLEPAPKKAPSILILDYLGVYKKALEACTFGLNCSYEKNCIWLEPQILLRRGFELSWQRGTKARWTSVGQSELLWLCD